MEGRGGMTEALIEAQATTSANETQTYCWEHINLTNGGGHHCAICLDIRIRREHEWFRREMDKALRKL